MDNSINSRLRVGALVQARLGSTRLPGKALLPLPLHPSAPTILRHVLGRAARATSLDTVVVATSNLPQDDALAAAAANMGWPVFRGDEQDVLSRFAGAAAAHSLEVVVRLTADNPAIDPHYIDAAVRTHLATGADYTVTTGLPLGTNLEVVTAAALARAHAAASAPDEREHVTPYLRRHPELFHLETLTLSIPSPLAGLRLTVDYPSDYALLGMLFSALGPDWSLADLMDLLEQHPWLAAINAGNVQR